MKNLYPCNDKTIMTVFFVKPITRVRDNSKQGSESFYRCKQGQICGFYLRDVGQRHDWV